MNRRSFLGLLGGLGVVGVGGYLVSETGPSGVDPATAFVDNRQTEPKRLSVTLRPHASPDPVFSRDLTVPGGERRRFEDVFPGPGRYHVVGTTPDGDSDDYDRVRVWREDGDLTGMAAFVKIRDDGTITAGAFLGAGVGNPPDERA